MTESNPSNQQLQQILESAAQMGVEMNEAEALQWLTAMAAWQNQAEGEIVVDERRGIFGHRVTMLDFNPDELAYFRKIGSLVEFKDQPGVETALALSGSAAQSKFQTYPGDADYFERINILAETRAEACLILARLMREKALATAQGPTYLLTEVRLGSYPQDVVRDGKPKAKGTSISWSVDEISAAQLNVFSTQGQPLILRLEDVAIDPGWCKLDWVIADPLRGKLANASNMLDVTWEAPDGSITPLDGYLDPYFQEVYLDAESVPIFSKLAQHVSADALDEYVAALEEQVNKYLTKDINYGKAAKRMYNIFRLVGRYEEAAFLRELFDEPASMLYQVWALIRTIDESIQPGSSIAIESVQAQADQLIVSVVDALEGDEEVAVVRHLLRLRDSLQQQQVGQALSADVEAARAEVINIVNNFFYEKLNAVPSIRLYIDGF